MSPHRQGGSRFANHLRRPFIIAHGDEGAMPQVPGIRPFDECDLADQLRFDRAACLNTHLFWSIEDACVKMETWRVDYNTRRPHSALANLPPAAFAASAMRREGKQRQKMEPLLVGNKNPSLSRDSKTQSTIEEISGSISKSCASGMNKTGYVFRQLTAPM